MAHYSTTSMERRSGMDCLREYFPDGEVDEMNFVLFSTSGIHGTYNTIEDAEAYLGGNEEESGHVTFLVVQPRIVHLAYGNAEPMNPEDIAFLKKLRASSWAVMQSIGAPGPAPLEWPAIDLGPVTGTEKAC